MELISFDNSKKGIAKNAILGLIFQFIIKFKGIIILPLIVHYLPKETLGEWRIVSTSIAIILPIITLNVLDGSGMFFSSDIEKRRVRIKYYTLLNLTIFITVIFIGLSLLFKNLIPLYKEYTLALILYFISSVSLKLSIFLYQTYQKSSKLLTINLLVEYGGAFLTLLLIFCGIKNLITLILPIVLLNVTLSLYLFPKIFKEIKYGYFLNKKFISNVLPTSIPLIPVYITEWILSSIGIYFLQYYYSTEVVGSYSVLLSIASLLLTLRATLQFFWFSTCSNMLQNNKDTEFNNILTNILKLYFLCCLLALVVYGFYNQDLINILANNSYNSIKTPLFFTALGYVFLIFSTIWNGMLYSLGESRKILWNYIYTSLVILLLSPILIKNYGINGASFAYMIGNIVLFALMFKSVKRVKFNFNKNDKYVNIIFIFLIAMISLTQFVDISLFSKRIIGFFILMTILLVSYFSNYIVPNKLLKLFKR